MATQRPKRWTPIESTKGEGEERVLQFFHTLSNLKKQCMNVFEPVIASLALECVRLGLGTGRWKSYGLSHSGDWERDVRDGWLMAG